MKRLIPYPLRVEARRIARSLRDMRSSVPLARKRVTDFAPYPALLAEQTSKLLREVKPQWQQLQRNKVENLRLACARIDGLVIPPGGVFSFCALVGRTTPRHGYREGLEMHGGEMVGMPGGGLCQLANLLYWLALHVDLEVVEHHRHDRDLFPDDTRTVPFGMGATVFYNYRDLRLRNNLDMPLLLRAEVREPLLWGGLYASGDKVFDLEIIETQHRFFRDSEGAIWRENHVSKRLTYKDGRAPLEREIAHNKGRVAYKLDPSIPVETE